MASTIKNSKNKQKKKNTKKLRKLEGITLIALVITIIILLILTGITISSLIGSGIPNANSIKIKRLGRNTEIIIDKEIEKLELITKEGYIFYITETETENKGKGRIVDTSD